MATHKIFLNVKHLGWASKCTAKSLCRNWVNYLQCAFAYGQYAWNVFQNLIIILVGKSHGQPFSLSVRLYWCQTFCCNAVTYLLLWNKLTCKKCKVKEEATKSDNFLWILVKTCKIDRARFAFLQSRVSQISCTPNEMRWVISKELLSLGCSHRNEVFSFAFVKQDWHSR